MSEWEHMFQCQMLILNMARASSNDVSACRRNPCEPVVSRLLQMLREVFILFECVNHCEWISLIWTLSPTPCSLNLQFMKDSQSGERWFKRGVVKTRAPVTSM